MIPSNTFVPVGCIVLIKGIDRQIQYTIIQRLVLKYLLVCFRRFQERLHLRALCHKLLVIQIAFVYTPHIYQAKQSQQTDQ